MRGIHNSIFMTNFRVQVPFVQDKGQEKAARQDLWVDYSSTTIAISNRL